MHAHDLRGQLPREWEPMLSEGDRQLLEDRLTVQERQAAQLRALRLDDAEPATTYSPERGR